MISRKLIDEARMLGNISRIQTVSSATGTDSNAFMKMLVNAMGKAGKEGSVRQYPLPFMENAAVVEAKAREQMLLPATSEAKFRSILNVVLGHEGDRYVRKDAGEESSKFGILQATAREYGYAGPVKNLSKTDAEAIYKKIWAKSGADKLPYPMSLVHFDTYVNSPSAANKLLKRSNGDIDAYLHGRAERYNRLAELRPARFGKYLGGWMGRIKNLQNIVKDYRYNQYFAANTPSGPSKT